MLWQIALLPGYAKATLNKCSERFEFASKIAAVRRYGEHHRGKIGPRSNLFSVALSLQFHDQRCVGGPQI